MALWPNFFVEESIPLIEIDIVAYLEEYEKYIQYICNRKYFLKDQKEDMAQHIRMELLKKYKNKHKYDDDDGFDWVTRSIIRRKAIDYTAEFVKKNKGLVFLNEVGSESGSDHEHKGSDYDRFYDRGYTDKVAEKVEDDERNGKIVAYIKDIETKISTAPLRKHFNDWCRLFIEIVLELHEFKNSMNKEDIMECMGYESHETQKFNSKLVSFREKLFEHLDIDLDHL